MINLFHTRSILSVPGDRPQKFVKAYKAGADLVHFDLEDSILPGRKDFARQQIALWLASKPQSSCCLRINKYGTEMYAKDIATFRQSCELVFIPKVESNAEINATAQNMQCPVVAIIETAKGVRDVNQILTPTPNLAGVVFGQSDFCADLRLPYEECLWASRFVLLAAKLAGVPIFASPWAWIDREPQTTDRAGFDGQVCLNPQQVKWVNKCYTPTELEISQAKAVVEQHRDGKENFYNVSGLLLTHEYIHWARLTLDRAACYLGRSRTN